MKKNKGFTLVELLVVVSIIALLVGLLLPALSRVRDSARQVKCGTNVRGIHQGLVAWSQDDDGQYPLPERNDPDYNSEVWDEADLNHSTNRTGNIWSLLIYNKVLNTEIFISPAETNVNIRKPKMGFGKDYAEYHFEGPWAAPQDTRFQAIYDPQFKGSASEFDGAAEVVTESPQGLATPKEVGHNSYAHAPVCGARLNSMWNTFAPSPIIPIVGNRGPIFNEVYPTREPSLNDGEYALEGIKSNTLGIHGGKATWEGNVVYNDGHTEFLTQPNPEGQRRIEFGNDDVDSRINDNMFIDEELPGVNASARNNSYLRIWSNGMPLDNEVLNANNGWFHYPDGHYMWAD
ncbi:MAG: prepilin-type N-terminal cleavage/methylation domain-containing protein [Phycisphaerales bacterium]|nr:prepilin-type N-terminal cleavage/methylation domain-containing protein [Phycisphaerales bacterium]